MPEFTADIQIWCATCGDGLCGQCEPVMNRAKSFQEGFNVAACENCLADREEVGYNKGYEVGYDEGYDTAMTELSNRESAS